MGCEKAVEVPIWGDEADDFHNCPFRFVAPNIFDFLEKYDIIKSGIVSPLPYGETSNRFLEAVRMFEGYLSKFQSEKQPQVGNNLDTIQGKKDA
jgi:hypothetical protein